MQQIALLFFFLLHQNFAVMYEWFFHICVLVSGGHVISETGYYMVF